MTATKPRVNQFHRLENALRHFTALTAEVYVDTQKIGRLAKNVIVGTVRGNPCRNMGQIGTPGTTAPVSGNAVMLARPRCDELYHSNRRKDGRILQET